MSSYSQGSDSLTNRKGGGVLPQNRRLFSSVALVEIMGVHPYWPEIPKEEKSKPVQKFTEWVKTRDAGRIGIGFNWADKEVFVGIVLTKVELETIIRRKKKKVAIVNTSRTVDI